MRVNSIAKKLLFAFGAIALLSLLAAVIGLRGFQRISDTQNSVVNKAVPVLRDAHSVTELNSRISTTAQSMNDVSTEQGHQAVQQALNDQIQAFAPLMLSLKNQGIDRRFLQPIEGSVENLEKITDDRSKQISTRIRLQERINHLSELLISNTVDLNELADSLVANAAATTTAVTSSLYDLVEQQANPARLFDVFDRLIEVDIDALERMYELRQRSANLNQIVSRVAKENQIPAIDTLESQAKDIVLILQRRINEIIDPQRKQRAQQLLASMHLDAGPIKISNIFDARRSLINLEQELVESERVYNEEARKLNEIVIELSATSGSVMTRATAAARQSLSDSRRRFIFTALLALVLMALILWRYVHHDVVRRLLGLKEATLSIAGGKLDHPVDETGHDELSEMAKVLRLFRDNAVAKKQLDEELKKYKDNLEVTVRERTLQLEETNLRLAEEVAQHDVAREKAEQANQAKTDFLATISHELRTPLSGALGTLNLLRQTGLSAEQVRYLDAVDNANSVLLDILDNVLGYSQVRAGKIEVENKAFELTGLLSGVVSVMQASAQERGNQLQLKIAENVPQNLVGDSGKLSQVLMNLLGNAAKFTESGEITLSVNRINDGQLPALLEFEVLDSGIGMDLSRKDEMFKAFTQADSSIARKYGGIGLGLAICRRLIELMRGEIAVDSAPGKGTSIRFTLAFEVSAAVSTEGKIVELSSSAYLRVLLVEDDPTNLEVAKQYLQHLGHQVTVAADGETALYELNRWTPDVVLLDVSLPGIDGLQVLAEIRRHTSADIRQLLVIAMSAHVFEEEVELYLGAGMDGFLGKPFSIQSLDNTIAKVTDISRTIVVENMGSIDDPDEVWWRSPILESEIIEEDVRVLGQHKVIELLATFKSSGEDYLTQMQRIERGADTDEIGKIAHSMKSAAGNFGFSRLAALLQKVERGNQNIENLIEQVEPLFHASNTAADELLRTVTVSQNI